MKKLAIVVAAVSGLFLFSGAAKADHHSRQPVRYGHYNNGHHALYQHYAHNHYNRYNYYAPVRPIRPVYVAPVPYYSGNYYGQSYYSSPRTGFGISTPNFQLYLGR
jgi:hypothetical protein